MNIEIVKDKKLTYLILFLYISYGLFMMMLNRKIEASYMAITIFILFKIVFNYDKCTISYIECKIRGVKKTEGYLYTFLNNFIQIRNEKIFIVFLIYIILLNYYYFKIKKQTFKLI